MAHDYALASFNVDQVADDTISTIVDKQEIAKYLTVNGKGKLK